MYTPRTGPKAQLQVFKGSYGKSFSTIIILWNSSIFGSLLFLHMCLFEFEVISFVGAYVETCILLKNSSIQRVPVKSTHQTGLKAHLQVFTGSY